MHDLGGSGSGGCSAPVRSEGAIVYNIDHRVLQGCIGNFWEALGPIGGKHNWLQVSAGEQHVCGLKSDGTAWCWGSGNNGRLGNGGATQQNTPVAVSGGHKWKSISAGSGHTCTIRTDDTAWCWGGGTTGALGTGGTPGSQTTPIQVAGGSTWKAIAAGHFHTCAIKSDDTLWCWGDNGSGEVGDNSTTQRDSPVQVGSDTWKAIAAGNNHSCGIKSDNSVWCWGDRTTGKLGDGGATSGSQLTPVAVAGGYSWKAITAGNNHSCGIQTDDTAWCWGQGGNGALGYGGSAQQTTPIIVTGGSTWKDISAAWQHSCGIKTDNTAWCWGSTILGNGVPNGQSNSPVAVTGGAVWNSISADFYPICAVRIDGTVRCWGSTAEGEMGTGAAGSITVPAAVAGGTSWIAAAAGDDHSCGIKSDNTAWCWGYNAVGGKRGDGTALANAHNIPQAVSGGATWKVISAGTTHTCAIKSDDHAWCWGAGGAGQRGDGSTSSSQTTPVEVSGSNTWKMISAGFHTCAIKSDDHAFCWGSGGQGQRGDGTTTGTQSTPVEVSGSNTWKIISASGNNHSCAIKTDDHAFCWGDRNAGKLGDGGATSGSQSTPVEVAGGAAWIAVSAGGDHSCGIKTDGSAWCWGSDGNQQLGNGATSGNQASPTAVAGGGTWKAISAGNQHSCGIKTDNSVWCWGLNQWGQLGDGTITLRNSPVAVIGGGTWSTVSAGDLHTCGVAGSTAFCWGAGGNGRLGDGVTSFSLSPVATYCGAPGRPAGSIFYNSSSNVMQYCDGVSWVQTE